MPSGIPAIGAIPWGGHICQFYRSESDLLDVLIPYFVAGLQNREKCLWITAQPLPAAAARDAIVRAWPEARRCIESGQLLVIDHDDWYLEDETAGLESVVRAWFDREAAACQEGYRGLRITGNTSWLKRDGGTDFCSYEEEVQKAFHGCNILALCSYALGDCSPNDVVDVVRNHQFAVLHRGESVERALSATMTLSMLEPALLASAESSPCSHHSVQFFDAAAYPAAQIAALLAAALEGGGGALAIAPSDRLGAISSELQRLGADPRGEHAARIRLVDASEALASFMEASGPDPGRFEAVVDALLGSLETPPERIQVYGEGVDVLVRSGRFDDALRLEKLWDGMLRRTRCKVHCGYTLQNFVRPGEDQRILDVSALHASIRPLSGDCGASRLAAGRLLAERDVYRWIVQHQSDQRRAAAPDLWEAERLSAALHTITSALFDAASLDDVCHVTRNEIARALCADHLALALVHERTSELRLIDHTGLTPSNAALYGNLPMAAELPLARVFRSGRTLVLDSPLTLSREILDLDGSFAAVAVVPLTTRRMRLGSLELGFAAARTFSSAHLAFLDDAAKQVSTAVERIRLAAALEEANRRKDEFLAVLGHELRTPLAPIMTALQLLQLRGIDAAERERAILARQVQHLSRIVDDLLDISRVAKGKIELRKERVELSSVLVRAIEIATPLIEERRHQLSVDAPVTGMVVHVDPSRFAQVIANVLINAAKYTEPGGRIALGCARTGARIEICVSDTGAGIPEDMVHSIFDPFVQLTDARRRTERGLGLGLALVRTLTELHGGSVHASSPGPGRGTTFTICFPATP